jgi:hypothetical protein
MSDMIRRNKAVPVKPPLQARRVEGQPEMVNVPGAIPPPQPGVTQNIIYVNMPAGQSAPPPPPQADPTEIHLHTHVHQYPNRRRGRHGTSFLGTLAFVLGGVGCGAAYVPQVRPLAQWIAMVAAGCAVLSLLGAMLFRRVGQGMPLLGLITSSAAYGLWMLQTGQAKMPRAISDGVSQIAAKVQQSTSATPQSPGSTQTPSNPSAPAITPGAPPVPRVDHSWFGTDDRSGSSPSAKPAPAGTPTAVTPPAQQSSVPPAPVIDLPTAKANLETARIAAARRLGIDYMAARTAADDARAESEQVRQTSPGSAELSAASQQWMDAENKLSEIRQRLRNDPAVAAAEQVLKTVEGKR